jgi:esterase/lipase superfamily enzyme
MNREYHKWFSPGLQRDMELLVFGTGGASVLFFPTRTARFYDYEDWKIIDAIQAKVDNGLLQVYCVDSIDYESFYNQQAHPGHRIWRHIQYEQYILNEVLPLIRSKNPNSYLISAGCSLGAYHAMNIALRHPQLFAKVVGMSGRYDLTASNGPFRDLLEGYSNENIYYNTPNKFIPQLTDERILDDLKKMEIIFAIGRDDPFLENNKHLSSALWEKGIWNALHIWEGEAHKAKYWKKMVNAYL